MKASSSVPPVTIKENTDEANVYPFTLPPAVCGAVSSTEFDNGIRQKIIADFQKQMYGKIPPPPDFLDFEVMEESRNALNGTAIRRQLNIKCRMKNGRNRTLSMLLYIPHSMVPVPCFFGLNFTGNQGCDADPAILPNAIPFLRRKDGRQVPPRFGEPGGEKFERFDFANVISRGYASATIYYSEVFADMPDGFFGSVMELFYDHNDWLAPDREITAISAWAWAIQRALDVLGKQPEIDAEKLIIHGHSRLGKTSLWAGANDPRPVMVISNNSGCCGASLSRRNFGETLAIITQNFPHWFVPGLRDFCGREDQLPFDQHHLLSLIAPRQLAVASASEDLHADPHGEFLSAKAASAVYRLYGKQGLPDDSVMPPANTSLDGDGIHYHLRDGQHNITPYDWQIYMDIADKILR